MNLIASTQVGLCTSCSQSRRVTLPLRRNSKKAFRGKVQAQDVSIQTYGNVGALS